MTEEVKRDRLKRGSGLLERKNDFTLVFHIVGVGDVFRLCCCAYYNGIRQ